MVLTGYFGAGGKMIHEKTRSIKSRDTVPLSQANIHSAEILAFVNLMVYKLNKIFYYEQFLALDFLQPHFTHFLKNFLATIRLLPMNFAGLAWGSSAVQKFISDQFWFFYSWCSPLRQG
jgi:hypothetical protein